MGNLNGAEKLIIYLPAFNEEEKIKSVIHSLPRDLPGIHSIEILVIDDGSNDKTASIALEAGATVVSHYKNMGLGIAFQTAVMYAIENEASILVSIDADGQFYPSEIGYLIKPIQGGTVQMVTGNRFANKKLENMPSIKYIGNKIMAKLVGKISNIQLQDVSCGFRAYSREALYNLNLFGVFSYTHEVILNLSFKGISISEQPVMVTYYPDRKSSISSNLFSYILKTLTIIIRTYIDYQPFKLFGFIGGLNFLLATYFVGFLMIHYFITGNYSPYKAYGFIGLGFGIFGLLILIIGLIADMIKRIRLNQEKILYHLKKKLKN